VRVYCTLVSVLQSWIDNSITSGTALKEIKEKRVTDRLSSAGRYEGMVDTIVQLFLLYASGVITRVHAI
jgi:hypothetical protein